MDWLGVGNSEKRSLMTALGKNSFCRVMAEFA